MAGGAQGREQLISRAAILLALGLPEGKCELPKKPRRNRRSVSEVGRAPAFRHVVGAKENGRKHP